MRKFLKTLTTLAVLATLVAAFFFTGSPTETSSPPSGGTYTIQAPKPGADTFRRVDLKRPYFLSLDTIVQVMCFKIPDDLKAKPLKEMTKEDLERVGVSYGTGTIIATNRILTAAHVIDHTAYCMVGEIPVTPIHVKTELDIAVLQGQLGATTITTVACDGFVKGFTYLSFGYARGTEFAMDISRFADYVDAPSRESDGTVTINKHVGLFQGSVTPGMSGGPVIGFDGRLYGVILATSSNSSFFRDVAETELCSALTAQPSDNVFKNPVTPTK